MRLNYLTFPEKIPNQHDRSRIRGTNPTFRQCFVCAPAVAVDLMPLFRSFRLPWLSTFHARIKKESVEVDWEANPCHCFHSPAFRQLHQKHWILVRVFSENRLSFGMQQLRVYILANDILSTNAHCPNMV